jgi:hypothetical protein
MDVVILFQFDPGRRTPAVVVRCAAGIINVAGQVECDWYSGRESDPLRAGIEISQHTSRTRSLSPISACGQY